MNGEPLRFLLVGGVGYALNLAAFAGLHAHGSHYVTASIGAYLLSNAFMYLGNRRFTFRLGRSSFWSAYGRYVLVGVVVAGLAAVLLAVLVEALGSDPRVGQVLALCAVTPIAFTLNRRWTFA